MVNKIFNFSRENFKLLTFKILNHVLLLLYCIKQNFIYIYISNIIDIISYLGKYPTSLGINTNLHSNLSIFIFILLCITIISEYGYNQFKVDNSI